jgi:hypothetical protein
MNQSELESILKKARQPEISGESLELFPRRIVARLKHNDPPVRAARNFSPPLAWVFGLAVCVMIALLIGHWRGRMESKSIPENDSLTSVKLVSETLAMFPNRLRAIMQDEHGLNLVLSETGDVPDSTPIYVRICDGKQCVSFVTFSGQEIQAVGQKVAVLADAHGGIILTGSQFVWSNTERIDAGNHLEIEARNLGAVAM